MAFKKFESKFNPVHKWADVKTLEGVFVGSHTAIFAEGERFFYTVETGKGEKVDVGGDAKLNSFFQAIPVGSMIKITSLGKEVNPKTKRSFNNYDLEYDDSTAVATPQTAKDIFGE